MKPFLICTKTCTYNSLFTSLPFHRIEKTGILLSLFLNNCEEGYKKKLSPTEIVEDFFIKHSTYTNHSEKLDILFRFIQFVERQVVLFDAPAYLLQLLIKKNIFWESIKKYLGLYQHSATTENYQH